MRLFFMTNHFSDRTSEEKTMGRQLAEYVSLVAKFSGQKILRSKTLRSPLLCCMVRERGAHVSVCARI